MYVGVYMAKKEIIKEITVTVKVITRLQLLRILRL